MKERLQKIMARANVGSRRHNEGLLSEGRVRVNGEVAHLGQSADPDVDRIEVDSQLLKFEKSLYIMLNKPKGVLSSTEDELGEGRQTVRDLIPLEGHLYPIGRLDRDSEGLMLLTNDGDLAHKLTHPRYGHKKTYRVWVERQPSLETLDKWRKGVVLDGEMTAPAEVEIVEKGGYVVELEIVMREGRKRQIRRIAAMLGYPVRRLVREKIGPIKLSGVKPGEWRELNEREVGLLKQATVRAESNVSRRGMRRLRWNNSSPRRATSASAVESNKSDKEQTPRPPRRQPNDQAKNRPATVRAGNTTVRRKPRP